MTIERKHSPIKLTPLQRTQLMRRALAAWFKTGGTEMPSGTSGIKMHQGRAYAVLHGTNGVLAVYRVRQVNDELMLRVLKRWPASVAKLPQHSENGDYITSVNLGRTAGDKATPAGSVGNDTGNKEI
jgi:hypothetical protein